jgi:hypothetical protein
MNSWHAWRMTHSVQLIIGRGEALTRFLSAWPARAVALKDGWQAAPVTEALHERITVSDPHGQRPEALDLAPTGLQAALAAATKAGGGLAYIETEYFGGTGGQSAVAYADGKEAFAPERSQGAAGPINFALRAIGVTKADGKDEFDTIGLGERRTMEDYEPEGPVRLRGEKPSSSREPPPVEPGKRRVPMWLAGVLIIGAILIGVAMAH